MNAELRTWLTERWPVHAIVGVWHDLEPSKRGTRGYGDGIERALLSRCALAPRKGERIVGRSLGRASTMGRCRMFCMRQRERERVEAVVRGTWSDERSGHAT